MLCTVSGIWKLSDGSVAPLTTFTFTPAPRQIEAADGHPYLPTAKSATTDVSGSASITLRSGPYEISAMVDGRRLTADFTVPDAATATFTECLTTAETVPAVDTLAATRVAMTGGGTAQDYAGRESRADFLAWLAGKSPLPGTVIHAGGAAYLYTGAGTDIPDMPGWTANSSWHINHFLGRGITSPSAVADAINTANAAILDAGGGVLHFDPITYEVDDTLVQIGNVIWEGQGNYFQNDYTNFDLNLRGTVIQPVIGLNKDLVRARADVSSLVVGQYPRMFGGMRNLMLHGRKSLDDAPGAKDLNNAGYGLRLQGVSYYKLRDVVVFRAPDTGVFSQSYDYGDGMGPRGCNNLDFGHVVAVGNGGYGIEAFGGDSQFIQLVCGYNGQSGANISAGPISNSLFWNNQERGLMISSGIDGVQVSNCWSYDNKFAGYYFISGGDHSIVGSRATNNGKAADGNNNNQCGILVSASCNSVLVDGCTLTDSTGTQLRAIYGTGAPNVIVGDNTYIAPTADVSFGDYANVRYHGKALTTLVRHPGFTAEGLIDMNGNRIENALGLSFSGEKTQSAALTSNTLDCGNYTLVNLSHSAGAQTINDITSSMAGRPIIIIRNSSGITHTITHNTSKLRCLAGASISFTANTAVVFMYVSGTIWQQIGGKL